METQYSPHVRRRIDISEPQMYDVLLINDDFTTMEFVVYVLKNIFYHNDVMAETIMRSVHERGTGVAGTYTLDIARSKVNKTMELARTEGFPLRLKIQKHEC